MSEPKDANTTSYTFLLSYNIDNDNQNIKHARAGLSQKNIPPSWNDTSNYEWKREVVAHTLLPQYSSGSKYIVFMTTKYILKMNNKQFYGYNNGILQN